MASPPYAPLRAEFAEIHPALAAAAIAEQVDTVGLDAVEVRFNAAGRYGNTFARLPMHAAPRGFQVEGPPSIITCDVSSIEFAIRGQLLAPPPAS
ncbi:hypothetical protein AX777_16290 [Sphingobium yanoikuyae]|uniref:Uncharacterized protein n=1 Tax=Sphingobium yanoikuyae TaxID=13690 RepID=A0A177K3U8_SPHYA|nr:hypothetical protein AX777_16290 [Sphingobium yanoikuyae]RSU68804.1 hypothetical protein BRX37_24625 [Sphingomonas sp. S-NIH.Pt3_0716]